MKRRGWRVALTVSTIGFALVAGLVAFNWATVRDHAQGWWFQATRETKAIRPFDSSAGANVPLDDAQLAELVFKELADFSGRVVIFDPAWVFNFLFIVEWCRESKDDVLGTLRQEGLRIVDQRFPRRAYVVTGYAAP